ncbi:MAG: InlB B-repeat-containing protein, partial [Muribaculaceae bacterium]|nr:InlB B-repeat-containing protein [Muribaculaceae bacterium]
EIVGSYTVNHYKLTYVVDGNVYKEYTVAYGEAITPEAAPVKEGFVFSGWDNVPTTMPAHDVTVAGSFLLNAYQVVFKIDGEIIATKAFEYGSEIELPAAPEKEGYTFAGWQDVPETMPAHDLEIVGSYTVNYYKLTYVVDGNVYKEYTVAYGEALTPEAAPVKEGFVFSGWDNVPATMPAHDVTVSGSFLLNAYQVVFKIDGEIIATKAYEYGSEIELPAAPEKEGYTFAGWQDVPETMPAHDLEIVGSYTVNQYKLTWMIDDEVYSEYMIDFGAEITVEEPPTKTGHLFSGWFNIQPTMPAHDLTITGFFLISSYEVFFKIDDEIIDHRPVDYGSTIQVIEAPEKEGYTFAGWQNVPESMPDHDIEIVGYYVSNVEITFSKKHIHLLCPEYDNATIRFTTDGTEPTANYGEIYTDPFLPATDCTIKAVAYREGSVTTMVTSYDYLAEEHTVPNLIVIPRYLERILMLVPETDETILAATDSIEANGRIILNGGEGLGQMDFPVEMFGDVAVFEWKSTELLERGPVYLPIEYASVPKIEYDGVRINVSGDKGSYLIYTYREDNGAVSESEAILDRTFSLDPSMTGTFGCYAYGKDLFRSEPYNLDIHALRFDEEQMVMLNSANWLRQAVPGDEAQEWESLSVVGPNESLAPIGSQDMAAIAEMSNLRHIDFTSTDPVQDTEVDFSSLSNLMSLSMPKANSYNCNWNLDLIQLLSAIKWNMPEAMTGELFAQVANHNALVYVDDLSLAPSNAVNIVCDGFTNKLTLNHDYPFCVIDDFTAETAVFTKNFSKSTVIGQSRGWESLVLPFDVDLIMHNSDVPREIRPFDAIPKDDYETPGFWLSCPSDSGDGWERQSHIEALTPYVIAMPNNSEYIEEFNITGNVDFIGHNVLVSDNLHTRSLTDIDGKKRTFSGSFIPKYSSDYVFSMTEENLGIIDNVEVVRSVFSPEGNKVRPFECWFEGAPGMSKIGMEGKTNAVDILSVSKDGIKIWQEGDCLNILSSADLNTAVVDMTGAVIRTLSLKSGEMETLSGLTKGLYIIANRKILVK